MKKYLLFVGDTYYPVGGWSDFKGSFDEKEDAINSPIFGDWWHIVDRDSMKIILTSRSWELHESN